MTSAVDKAKELLKESLSSLRSETKAVEGALSELDGKPAKKRAVGRPKGSGSKAKPRRRSGKKTRTDEAVKLIEGKPGISASDIAKTMKIKPNYLYRVLGDLEKEGRVSKKGRQYFPAG